jgi:hypothetical protein
MPAVLELPRALGHGGEPFVEPPGNTAVAGRTRDQDVRDLMMEYRLQRVVRIADRARREDHHRIRVGVREAGDPRRRAFGKRGVGRGQHDPYRIAGRVDPDEPDDRLQMLLVDTAQPGPGAIVTAQLFEDELGHDGRR